MTLVEKIAVACISLSWLIFAGVFLVPLLFVEHDELVVAGAIYVVSQVAFWSGCAIGGRAVLRRYQVHSLLKRWLLRCREP